MFCERVFVGSADPCVIRSVSSRIIGSAQEDLTEASVIGSSMSQHNGRGDAGDLYGGLACGSAKAGCEVPQEKWEPRQTVTLNAIREVL